MLRKIQTDKRASLNHSTTVNLISIKFNIDSCCHDAELEDTIINKRKGKNVDIAQQSVIILITFINLYIGLVMFALEGELSRNQI